MKTIFHSLHHGHEETELWADGHPAMFSAWCGEDLTRKDLDPTRHDALLRGVTTNPILLVQAIAITPSIQEGAWAKMEGRDPKRFARLLRDQAVCEATAAVRVRFGATGGRDGWVSAQVDPYKTHDVDAMVREGEELAALAANVMVKLPATEAGIAALENLTANGIATNTTLLTTTSQARAALDALGRGRGRRKERGPWRAVLTFMVGRLGDALVRTHSAEIDAHDARRIELLALEAHHQLVSKAGDDAKLLICSLRVDAIDQSLGTESAHLAAAHGKPWILTCPTPFIERVLALATCPTPITLSEEHRSRLCRLPHVKLALDPDALPVESFVEWPALVQNRIEHIAAQDEVFRLAQHLMENLR